MALSRLSFGRDWTDKNAFPSYLDNEAQVRADMQYHPNAVRDYINGMLLAELEAKGAASQLGAVDSTGKAATIQTILNTIANSLAEMKTDIETIASGGVPAVIQSVAVAFTEDSWSPAESGVLLVIGQTEHKRTSANFGYNLYAMADRVYVGGAPVTASTQVVYSENGSIILMASEAYSGKIVFFGL